MFSGADESRKEEEKARAAVRRKGGRGGGSQLPFAAAAETRWGCSVVGGQSGDQVV